MSYLSLANIVVMSKQIKRIFSIYKKLQNGLKVTTSELLDEFRHDNDVSIRSIQRDIKLIQELDPFVEQKRAGLDVEYQMAKEGRKISNVEIFSNQVLSFYFLKAHLNAFKNTVIEEDVNLLSEKLEKYARGDVLDDKSLYWDKNFGYYDYTQSDPQIRRVINAIVSEEWVDVKYETEQNSERSIICKLIKMFSYNGSLYAVAYIKHHNSFIALAIQNILYVNELYRPTKDLIYHKVPEFDMDEFSKYRFGVFWGNPKRVELLIDKKFKKYFINRNWHKSQRFSSDENDNLILVMNVPVSPELKSWIMFWADAIKVIAPDNLKKQLLALAENFIERNKLES
jgi:predicted DNA-binding transcriptional regulator YafY